jgi:hypothetical protein
MIHFASGSRLFPAVQLLFVLTAERRPAYAPLLSPDHPHAASLRGIHVPDHGAFHRMRTSCSHFILVVKKMCLTGVSGAAGSDVGAGGAVMYLQHRTRRAVMQRISIVEDNKGNFVVRFPFLLFPFLLKTKSPFLILNPIYPAATPHFSMHTMRPMVLSALLPRAQAW